MSRRFGSRRCGRQALVIRVGPLLGLFWILMASTSVLAGNLETVIAPPKESPQAGQVAEFSVYIHNIGDEIVPVHLPAQVSCRIQSADRTVEVVATAVQPFLGPPSPIVQGGFVKGRYAFTVPEGVEGPLRMEVREFDAPGVMFAVAAPAQP